MKSNPLVNRIIPRSVRNWFRSPAKSVQYLFDRVAYRCGYSASIAFGDNWRVLCHPASLSHFRVFKAAPQARELADFVEHCTPEMQFLDVGAHYGFFALAALHFGAPNSRVVCVEPSKLAVDVLQANMQLNCVHPEVLVCALGDRDGELPMLNTGPFGSDYLIVPTKARCDVVLIPQLTLTTVLARTGLRATHIKFDIEGYELEVIQSSKETLSKQKPVLFLELHGNLIQERGENPALVIESLQECGYSRFMIDGRAMGVGDMVQMGFNCRMVCLP